MCFSEENPDYIPHGQRVVDYFTLKENGGLTVLERIWRQHFLDTMKPKYLPELWSVDHNVERYKKYFNQIVNNENQIE